MTTDDEKAFELKDAGWRRRSRTRPGPTRGAGGRPQEHVHFWYHPDGRHDRGVALGVTLATAWRIHRREMNAEANR